MTTETTVSQELLSADEIAMMADCRRALKETVKRATRLSYDQRVKDAAILSEDTPGAFYIGILARALEQAESALFQAMNVAHNYCKVEVPDDDMYAR